MTQVPERNDVRLLDPMMERTEGRYVEYKQWLVAVGSLLGSSANMSSRHIAQMWAGKVEAIAALKPKEMWFEAQRNLV
jgi:hypothetical protein